MRLLVVEDDPVLASGMQRALAQQGHAVDRLHDGRLAVEALLSQPFDLAVLDIGLPGLDGFQVLREARGKGCKTPILVVSARGELGDRVHGLDSGADDYLPKPFELTELEARVRALLRRSNRQASATLRIGSLELDTNERSVRLVKAPGEHERVELSPREYATLELLMTRADRVVSKEQIVSSLSSWDNDFSENTVEVYIHRVRKKIQSSDLNIRTVRGFGYLLEHRSP